MASNPHQNIARNNDVREISVGVLPGQPMIRLLYRNNDAKEERFIVIVGDFASPTHVQNYWIGKRPKATLDDPEFIRHAANCGEGACGLAHKRFKRLMGEAILRYLGEDLAAVSPKAEG